MTAILLDIVFITAISRALNMSIHKIISSTKREDVHENVLSQEPNVTNHETVAVHSSNSVSPDKAVSSLSQSQLEVANIVDAFAATYNAAYRSVSVHLDIVFISPSCFYSHCCTDLLKELLHCSRWQLIP